MLHSVQHQISTKPKCVAIKHIDEMKSTRFFEVNFNRVKTKATITTICRKKTADLIVKRFKKDRDYLIQLSLSNNNKERKTIEK